MSITVQLTVNGQPAHGTVEPRVSLADFLRNELDLTGTHLGCEHGVCGACTVLVDGEPVRSCLMFAVQAQGSRITTVEGLATGDTLTPLQTEFNRHHALQCGFCTPGFLMTATALLAHTPNPSAEQVRDALSGNICRCTGYIGIVQAVLAAANSAKS
jgi:aerobic carbon-monoxide dehydrogenase small subunit